MKLKYITLTTAALSIAAVMQAQPQAMVGGSVMRMSDFRIDNMLQFSQYDYSFGSARTAAMGGAFSSLGADLSSMAINPAGLGMYRSSDFGFSPSITWTDNKSSLPGPYYTESWRETFTRFTFNNIGAAFNTYQGAGDVTSVTFGVGYQKLADFNYNGNIGMNSMPGSITDVFARQAYGTDKSNFSSSNKPFWVNPPNMWGAVTAYSTAAIDTVGNTSTYRANLMDGVLNDNYYITETRGSIGEYDISAGINFRNKFYLGFTLGIQDIYYRQDAWFNEAFLYSQQDLPAAPGLRSINDNQYVQYDGSGVNFKLGMIFRPTEALRLGLAIHTPTLVYLESLYGIYFNSDMVNTPLGKDDHGNEIIYTGQIEAASYPDDNEWGYSFITPTRLIAGASYQIGNAAILSADYERVWYNGMRARSSYDYYMDTGTRNAYKQDIKYCFRPANNFRAGLEVKPIPELALRAGYAYYDTPISDKPYVVQSDRTPVSYVDGPVASKVQNFSVGAGFRFGAISLDATYVYAVTDYTKYALYWYDDHYDPANTVGAGHISSSMERNMITLAMSVKF